MHVDTLPDALLAASRLPWYLGIVLVIGASAFRLFVTPAAGVQPLADRTTLTVGLIGVGFLLGGLCARLYAQTFAYFGTDEPLTMTLFLEVATVLPPWSTGWLQQAGAALTSAATLIAVQRGLRVAWLGAHAAALAVGMTAPMTGHAVGQDDSYLLPIALQAGHVIGAGIWLGGLAVLLAVAVRLPAHDAATGPRPLTSPLSPAAGCQYLLPRFARLGPLCGRMRRVRNSRLGPHCGPTRLQATLRLVDAFSPMALAGATVLMCTGALTTWVYLDSLSDLWMTSYGLALVTKSAMVAAVLLAGFANWRYVRPRLRGDRAAPLLLHRTAAIELTCALVVLAITAVLVGLPQPGD